MTRGNSAQEHFSNTLQYVLSATGVGLWDWDLASGQVIYSKEWEAIAGYGEGELPQTLETWESLVLDEDLAGASAAIDGYLAGDRPEYVAEFRMRRKDGSIIWAQDRGVNAEWDSEGNPTRLIGILQDVTRMKRAEESIKEKTEQLDFVAMLCGLGTWEWFVREDRIVYGENFVTMLGYEPFEIQGTLSEWDGLIHPDDLPASSQALGDYLSAKTDVYRQEMRMRRKDGSYIWMLDMGRTVEWDKNGEPVRLLGGLFNIDDMKTTEHKLHTALQLIEKYNERLKAEVTEAIKSLEDSRQLNQTMFDANPYVCLLFDDQMRVIDCNPAAIEYLHQDSKEHAIKTMLMYIKESIPPTQPDGKPSVPFAVRMRDTIEHGYSEFETELIHDGVLAPMRVIMKKLKYNDSFAIAVYQVDLTSLVQARSEILRQDKLLKAANGVASMLMSATLEEDLPHVMRGALQIMGESVGVQRVSLWQSHEKDGDSELQLIGCWTNTDEGDREERPPALPRRDQWQDVINGPVDRVNLRDELRDELTREGVQSVLLKPVHLNGQLWGILRFDDRKTRRVFAEADVNILYSEGLMLASAVQRSEMTANLIRTREEALASTRAKSEFLSRMSHEIRTPMNAIIGMTTIAKRVDEIDKFRYCLDKIEDASQQLLGIINDVLDISKIEANKFEIHTAPFDFEKMMKKVISVIQVKADEKNQVFNYLLEPGFERTVHSDELRLSQVMINLLGNAVKFTPEYGTITIHMTHTPMGGDDFLLRVEVKDTGIGITPEQQSRLFRSFEQADGGITRKYGGTGLGLSICRKIINLMGGDIRVESVADEGSTFTFEVNASYGVPLSALEPSTPRKDLRMLMVDDDEDTLAYYKSLATGFGLECDTHIGGIGVADRVRAACASGTPYDFIFIDWTLKELPGEKVASEIQRVTEANAHVVAVSAADWTQIEPEANRVGVVHFLQKPVLPSALFNTIANLTSASPSSIAPAAEINCDWTGKSVLIVEDIAINREIIETILEETGLTLEVAVNGVEAVEMFREKPMEYDLILMDMQMPEMDGLAATRRIRGSGLPNAEEIPILAMTANAFKEDVMACIEAGMNDHVAKPIDVDDLMEKLSRYLSR